MGETRSEGLGDNIEFTAVDIDEYEIFFSHPSNTSANDTATTKYPDNTRSARKFAIRCDKNTDLIEINGMGFTDPVLIVEDKPHRETRTIGLIFKIKLRTNAPNTVIKVRWF